MNPESVFWLYIFSKTHIFNLSLLPFYPENNSLSTIRIRLKKLDLVPLQSKFFPTKIFICILEKEILAGKNLLTSFFRKNSLSALDFQTENSKSTQWVVFG